ncbi:hypothetical protein N7533_012632 [Penicillium manginii]|uniref:uncharacterized protein n=1 Tax=Penicillium manginii TaxID=203109 RepID=UPI002547E83C|nr:uncharacterized protein N7533_012632 [Penicillium manginii]KAJ5739848.1 hypothetical protein N7533_012632 [Penicillium manginii]
MHENTSPDPQGASPLFIIDITRIFPVITSHYFNALDVTGKIHHTWCRIFGPQWLQGAFFDMIQSCGADVHIMGSRKTGSMAANELEGWRGIKLDEIEKKAMQSVTNFKPNIFTNLEIDSFGKRMGNLLDFLWLECLDSTVILSTLLLNTDQQTNSRILRVKDQIRALVEEKAAAGRFVIVDMHTDKGPRSKDFVDGTHPGDLGYRKVAKIWLDGIQDASLKNFFETANSY